MFTETRSRGESQLTMKKFTDQQTIDAWNKMLNQLGNLHEAGQQLAEARERAAKAETEVRFLRERLAELRQQKEPAPTPPSEPEPPATPLQPPEKAWQYLMRRVRERVQG